MVLRIHMGRTPPEAAGYSGTPLAKKLGVAVAFFTSAAMLEKQLDSLGAMIFPAGGLWIAWPKKTSGVATDLGDNAVRAAALPRGLVDNKVCALDATWSALRLVWRRENR